MNTVGIINKKRLGQKLSKEELDFVFNGYLNGSIKDSTSKETCGAYNGFWVACCMISSNASEA